VFILIYKNIFEWSFTEKEEGVMIIGIWHSIGNRIIKMCEKIEKGEVKWESNYEIRLAEKYSKVL